MCFGDPQNGEARKLQDLLLWSPVGQPVFPGMGTAEGCLGLQALVTCYSLCLHSVPQTITGYFLLPSQVWLHMPPSQEVH